MQRHGGSGSGSGNCRLVSLRSAIGSARGRGRCNELVNVFCVIVEFGIPRPTKGANYVCTLKLVDESWCETPITINMFASDRQQLPRVKSIQDLIILSNVRVISYDGDFQLSYNKHSSSFALFHNSPSPTTDFNPYQTSFNNYRFNNLRDHIQCLTTWLSTFQLQSGRSEYLVSLKELKEGRFFDLIIKVLYVCEVDKDKWMFFVWDGTDTPPLSFSPTLESDGHNPLQLEPLPLSREILSTFPCIGSVLRIIVDCSYEKFDQHIRNEKWLRLRNVTCKVESSLWQGVFTNYSKIRLLSKEDNNIVSLLLRTYNERVSAKLTYLPLSCLPNPSFITEVDFGNAACSTLMDVLTNSRVLGKFKCVVRVVATYPRRVEEFCDPNGTYRLRLTLEDPTSRLHAFLYADDAEKFFGSHLSVEGLRTKRSKLLGISTKDNGEEDETILRNPPWIVCHLKSYCLDKTDEWGTRCFQIFGTRLHV